MHRIYGLWMCANVHVLDPLIPQQYLFEANHEYKGEESWAETVRTNGKQLFNAGFGPLGQITPLATTHIQNFAFRPSLAICTMC